MICAREEDMKGKKIKRRGDKRRGIRPYHAASVRGPEMISLVQTRCGGASFRCISRAIASGAAFLPLFSQSERPPPRAITTAVIEEEDR